MSFPDATLLLIGHGSTVNEDSGATVHQHVTELRRRRLFADVQAAFFKIEPRIGPVLAAIRTPRVFVVPMFVSDGYFTRQAIPCELGLPEGAQEGMPCTVRLHGRNVIYCHPVGTHPLMTEIILARAMQALTGADRERNIQHPTPNIQHPVPGTAQPVGCSMLDVGCWMFPQAVVDRQESPETSPPGPQLLSTTALVIAGHGTALNAESRKSIEDQVERISARGLFAEVHPAFLEEEPRIGEFPTFVAAPRIVVVPFFMSDGLHVCEDIPVLLGESAENVRQRLLVGEWPWRNPTERRGKTIYYTRGVGGEPGIADVILERVRSAGCGCL